MQVSWRKQRDSNEFRGASHHIFVKWPAPSGRSGQNDEPDHDACRWQRTFASVTDTNTPRTTVSGQLAPSHDHSGIEK